jgi:hypothetical protein
MDNLAETKLNMSEDNHCVPYFSGHKVNKLFNACNIERKILFPCVTTRPGKYRTIA